MTSDVPDRDGPSDLEVLELQYEAAQARLAEQRDTIKSFSQEARKLYRMLLLLITVPATLIGAVATPANTPVSAFLTRKNIVATVLGDPLLSALTLTFIILTLLIISAGANWLASGFDALAPRKTANPNDIYQTVTQEMNEEEYLKHRLDSYLIRIEENDRTIKQSEFILVLGKVPVMFAIGGLGIIGLSMISGSPVPVLPILVVVLVALPLLYLGLPDSFKRADASRGFVPPYPAEYTEYKNSIKETVDNLPETEQAREKDASDLEETVE